MSEGIENGKNSNQKKIFGRDNANHTGPEKAASSSVDGPNPTDDFDESLNTGNSFRRSDDMDHRQWRFAIKLEVRRLSEYDYGRKVLHLNADDLGTEGLRLDIYDGVILNIQHDNSRVFIESMECTNITIDTSTPNILRINADSEDDDIVKIDTHDDIGVVDSKSPSLIVVTGRNAAVTGHGKSSVRCENISSLSLKDESCGYAINALSARTYGNSVAFIKDEESDYLDESESRLIMVCESSTVVVEDVHRRNTSLTVHDDAVAHLCGITKCQSATSNSTVHIYDDSYVERAHGRSTITSTREKDEVVGFLDNGASYQKRLVGSKYGDVKLPNIW